MVTPAAKRKAVAHLVRVHGMSERRACKAIGCCRMTVRYQTSRADDAGLRERMRPIAHERRRFGYRRLHVLLKREGYLVNHKKLFRLYLEERLTVRRRGGSKRAIGTRAPMTVPLLPNLCVGSDDRWPALPHPDRGRRLHPRVPGAGGRHFTLGRPGRTRVRPAGRRARQTR